MEINGKPNVDKTKVIKKEEGAIQFKAHGENHFVLNWKDSIVELYHNGKKKFIIDMNKMGDKL